MGIDWGFIKGFKSVNNMGITMGIWVAIKHGNQTWHGHAWPGDLQFFQTNLAGLRGKYDQKMMNLKYS